MSELPEELLEKIFALCDGATLVRSSRVSTRVRKMTERTRNDHRFWKKCVLSEIQLPIVEEILGKNSLSFFDDLVEDLTFTDLYRHEINIKVPWFKIYVSWYLGRKISSKHPVMLPICGFETSPVSVAKVSGDLIVLGHMDGSVSVCDYAASNIEIVAKHNRKVNDIALINLTNRRTFTIYDSSHKSISQHHHIVSISRDQTAKLYPFRSIEKQSHGSILTVRPVEAALDHVRIFNDLCVIYSHICQVSVWRISLPAGGPEDEHQPLVFEPLQIFGSRDQAPGWMGFWDEKIYTVCGEEIRLSIYDTKQLAWTQSLRPTQQSKGRHVFQFSPPSNSPLPRAGCDIFTENNTLRVKISHGFVFRDGIIFLVTVSKSLYYSFDFRSLHMVCLGKYFDSAISSVCLWGSYLAFGLANGRVLVYNIPNRRALKELGQMKPQFKRIIAPNHAISSLDVFNIGKGPILIASTGNKLYLLFWFFFY